MAEVRPIDGKLLVYHIATEQLNLHPLDYTTNATYAKCMKRVDAMPTLDYEPVRHGEWTAIDASCWRWKHDGPHHVMRLKYKRTECGKIVVKKEPYCPRCGAKMDGGKNYAETR